MYDSGKIQLGWGSKRDAAERGVERGGGGGGGKAEKVTQGLKDVHQKKGRLNKPCTRPYSSLWREGIF